jgi:hypothetical protein
MHVGAWLRLHVHGHTHAVCWLSRRTRTAHARRPLFYLNRDHIPRILERAHTRVYSHTCMRASAGACSCACSCAVARDHGRASASASSCAYALATVLWIVDCIVREHILACAHPTTYAYGSVRVQMRRRIPIPISMSIRVPIVCCEWKCTCASTRTSTRASPRASA